MRLIHADSHNIRKAGDHLHRQRRFQIRHVGQCGNIQASQRYRNSHKAAGKEEDIGLKIFDDLARLEEAAGQLEQVTGHRTQTNPMQAGSGDGSKRDFLPGYDVGLYAPFSTDP